MHYIVPALLAEGSTDNRFLGALFSRLLSDVVHQKSTGAFEIADVEPIGESAGLVSPSAVGAVLEENHPYFTLFLVHRDSDSRSSRKSDEWTKQVVDEVDKRQLDVRIIFVTPIVMMEAWGLADGQALREVLGVTWTDERLGVPDNPAHVELEPEPKTVLKRLAREVSGPDVDLLSRLGSRVALDRLGRVPAFASVVTQILDVLQSQGVVA